MLPTGALERASSESEFVDAVQTASMRLMRIALGFGLACTTLVLVGAIVLGKNIAAITVASLWVLAWSVATAKPAKVWWLIDHHFLKFSAGVVIASGIGVAVTGGIDSPVPVDANWIVWSVSIVVSVRKVLTLSLAIGASHLVGFMAGGPWSSDAIADPTYYALTQIVNPIAMAIAALALTGVFRLVLISTPEILEAFRSGTTLDSPRLSPWIALPLAGDCGTVDDQPTPTGASDAFTPAELDIIDRLARGEKPKQIAFESRRSPNTIYEHIANAKRKCGARTTTHLITRAWRVAD